MKLTHWRNFSVLGLVLASSLARAEGEVAYKITAGSAGFTAVGKPGFLRITGENGVPTGTISIEPGKRLASSDIHVPLAPLTTGIDMRDHHMKEKFLQTEKFPEATFKANELAFPGGKLPESAEVPGTFTVHGVSKPVTATVTIKAVDKGFDCETDFEITVSDFGMDIPSFAGVTMADKVKVHAAFTALSPAAGGKG